MWITKRLKCLGTSTIVIVTVVILFYPIFYLLGLVLHNELIRIFLSLLSTQALALGLTKLWLKK